MADTRASPAGAPDRAANWALADSHVHLDRYSDAEVGGMLRRAAEAGVGHLLTVGVDLASSRAAVALAGRHSGVRAAVGTHPTRIAGLVDPEAELRTLAELARSAGVVAIGEVGLDAGAGPEALALQERFFRECLDLAGATGLPVVLHVVGAHESALALLRIWAPLRAVVHYFVGDAALAERYLELGCLIAVGKPAARRSEAALREVVATIPLDRLLLETDTYPLPGRTTEPRDVALVCAAVAELRGLDRRDVAKQTTNNFLRLFKSAPGA